MTIIKRISCLGAITAALSACSCPQPGPKMQELQDMANAIQYNLNLTRHIEGQPDVIPERSLPDDPWGIRTRCTIKDGSMTLYSAGPDRLFETDDDVVITKPLK